LTEVVVHLKILKRQRTRVINNKERQVFLPMQARAAPFPRKFGIFTKQNPNKVHLFC
jgi:hypothetical protein